MGIIDKSLEKLGLKYEDLTDAERETYMGWMESLSKNRVTVESVRTYISSMRDNVEIELTRTDLNSKQDLLLKARLRNYMLLEAFLSTPEKARKALERQMSGLVGKKG